MKYFLTLTLLVFLLFGCTREDDNPVDDGDDNNTQEVINYSDLIGTHLNLVQVLDSDGNEYEINAELGINSNDCQSNLLALELDEEAMFAVTNKSGFFVEHPENMDTNRIELSASYTQPQPDECRHKLDFFMQFLSESLTLEEKNNQILMLSSESGLTFVFDKSDNDGYYSDCNIKFEGKRLNLERVEDLSGNEVDIVKENFGENPAIRSSLNVDFREDRKYDLGASCNGFRGRLFFEECKINMSNTGITAAWCYGVDEFLYLLFNHSKLESSTENTAVFRKGNYKLIFEVSELD